MVAATLTMLENIRTRTRMWINNPAEAVTEIIPTLSKIQVGVASASIDFEANKFTLAYEGSVPYTLSANNAGSEISDILTKPKLESVNRYFVQLAIVAAVAEELTLDQFVNNEHTRYIFSKGQLTSPPVLVGSCTHVGITVSFVPDPSIFEPEKLSFYRVVGRLGELAVTYAPLSIQFTDHTTRATRYFHYIDGLKSYLAERVGGGSEIITLEATDVDVTIKCAMVLYFNAPLLLETFVNDRRTFSGGSHVDGFKRACRELAAENSTDNLWQSIFGTPDSIACVIAAYAPLPGWDDPLHRRIKNAKIEEMTRALIYQGLEKLPKIHKRRVEKNRARMTKEI